MITRKFQADNNPNKEKEDTGIIKFQTHKNFFNRYNGAWRTEKILKL